MAYAEKRGKSWRVRYKLPSGEYDSQSGFETKQDALDWGRAQETDVRRKVFVNPRDGRTLFGTWVAEWLPTIDVGETTIPAYESRLNSAILPQWEHVPLADVSSMSYKAWKKRLKKQYKPGSVTAIESIMRMILDDAVEQGLIAQNPMPTTAKRRRGRHASVKREDTYVWPTPEHALQLAENARALRGPRWHVMILTMAYTGLRMGEVAGLRRDQVQLVGLEYGRSIRVQWQGQWLSRPASHMVSQGETLESIAALRLVDQGRAPAIAEVNGLAPGDRLRPGRELLLPKGFTLIPPKYSSYRTLILPPFLGDMLLELLAEPADHPYLVFPSQRGKPLKTDDQFYGRFWEPIVNGQDAVPTRRGHRAVPAVPPVKGMAGLVPHGLRHGHKVWLDEQGHARVAVEERMGHELPGVEGTYSHTSPDMELGIARGLQAAWEKSISPPEQEERQWRRSS